MASFTDKQIPTFNPYVQQLPVQAMVEVGMQKQKQYDEGIQKIQTSIDNVAGLDIMRGVDKTYLQSKLNHLGNNLRTVAAGDFSNYQLVNSVSGMTGQIINDNNIKTAVYSTQIVRKGQKELEVAKKEGKSSIQNEDYWNSQVSGYLNNTDLKTSFNAEYVPYIDLSEKYAKIAKDVESIERGYDIPYISDAKGNPKYFKKDKSGQLVETPPEQGGELVVDDVMKSITIKGKSAETILNNFYDSTTENDRRQLMIDAKYHYKNATPETFKKDIVANFALRKTQLTEYSTEIGVALHNPKISDKDKAVLTAKLIDINNQLAGGLEKKLQSTLQDLQDPSKFEAFKVNLYTEKYLTNLAQDKSTESYKEELKSNPIAQAIMEKKKFEFDIQKENTRINQWNATFSQTERHWQTERQDKLDEKLGSEINTESGGRRTDIPKTTSTDLTVKIDGLDKTLKQLDNEFLSANKSTYTKAQLDEFAKNYDGNPGSVNTKDPELFRYLDNRRTYEHERMQTANLRDKLKILTADVTKQLDATLNSQPGIAVNGRTLYNSEELYSFWTTRQEYVSTGSGHTVVGPYTGASKTTLDAEGLLKRYKNTKYEPLAIAAIKAWQGNQLTPVEQQLIHSSANVFLTVSPMIDKLYKTKLDMESEYLATKMPEYMSMRGALSTSNKVDMDNVDRLITMSMVPPTGSLDVDEASVFNATTVAGWKNDPKIQSNLRYIINKNYDGSGSLIVQHGTEQQTIPLSADQFMNYFPRYAVLNPITKMKNDILSSPENTTNPLRKNEPTTAAYTGNSIPNLRGTNFATRVRYDVEGASSNNGSSSDGYVIRVYACDDKGGWHQGIITEQGYIGEGKIQAAIDMIGMEVVEKILKK